MLLPLLLIAFPYLFVSGRAVKNVHEQGSTKQFFPSQLNALVTKGGQEPFLQDSIATDDTSGSRLGFPRTGEHIVIGGHNASLGKYLWSGRTGEYYEVSGGWPGWEGDVVAKEFYIWYWPHELARELKYLSRVGQLITHDTYEGIQWLIMHKPPGVHLTKTQAFKEAYRKGRRECDDLVETVYEPAFNALLNYIRRYGIFHQVSNARMLWDKEAKNVSLFDFGDDEECDPKTADDQDMRNKIALDVYISWPNDGISYQDWCVNGQAQ